MNALRPQLYKKEQFGAALRGLRDTIRALKNLAETEDGEICRDLIGVLPRLDDIEDDVENAAREFNERGKPEFSDQAKELHPEGAR
jgi:hypothetical protein